MGPQERSLFIAEALGYLNFFKRPKRALAQMAEA
jgi:hypothetical protein